MNEREVETNDSEEGTEAQITSIDEVLLPDAITPSIKLFVFNIVLPTIDIGIGVALPLSPLGSSQISCSPASLGGEWSPPTRKGGAGFSSCSSSGLS